MTGHDNCFLCRYSLPEWHTAIATNAKLVRYKKGQPVFKEGDPVTGFYFLHKGKVKVHKQWGREKELIVKFAREGDVIGHRGIGKDQYYPVSATAIEDVEGCFTTSEFLQTTLRVNNELTYQMMLFYAGELQDAERGMRNMVHMDVKSRIADSLLSILHIFGADKEGYIDSALTRQDIASFAGTTYETLFKVLNELIHDSIIAISGKHITILNKEQLTGLIKLG